MIDSNKLDGWSICQYGDLLDYIQPTQFIVESTNYKDRYITPVLTAGKSFVKGYTNEEFGIFEDWPVIIFDDFTTASRYVNFSFKVKSSAMKILKPCCDLVNLKFVYYSMQTSTVSADTHKRYWISICAKEKMALPPLNEQNRIVSKIEELFSELDKGVESLKTAQAQLKVYRQSLLKHAFEGKLTTDWREANIDKLERSSDLLARIRAERESLYQQQLLDWEKAIRKWELVGEKDKKPAKPRQQKTIIAENGLPLEMPEEWASDLLGNLNVKVFDGPFGSNLKTSDYVEKGVRVIRLENIGYLEFVDSKYSYVAEEKYRSIKKHTVQHGDLIFSSFIIEGIRVVVLPNTIDRAVNKADCFCVRLLGECVRNDYVAYFLSSRHAFKQIEPVIHGVGRPRINTTQLKAFKIPLCSQEEQAEIMLKLSEKYSIADRLEIDIELQLNRSEVLRQSILKRAFSGELVPQDSNDESASVLLERIKTEKAAFEEPIKRMKGKKAA